MNWLDDEVEKALDVVAGQYNDTYASQAISRAAIRQAVLNTIAKCAEAAEDADVQEVLSEEDGRHGVELAVKAIKKLGEP